MRGPSRAAPVLLAAGCALAGCGAGGSPAQQLARWADGSGFVQTLARLRGDLARVGAPAAPGAVRTTCDVLVTDSLTANEQLPTPDDRLTALLSSAYTAAAGAGHDCFAGAGGDAALLARAASQRDVARRDLVEAEARYDAVSSPLPRSAP